MNNQLMPKGWNFQKDIKGIKGVFPKKFPPYQGVVLIIASHGECFVHGTIQPLALSGVEDRLYHRYGDTAIDWLLYTVPHTSYWENKHRVIEEFYDFPMREGFFVAGEPANVISRLPELSFLDEREKKTERAEKFCEEMKNFMLTGKTGMQLAEEVRRLHLLLAKAAAVIDYLKSLTEEQQKIIWLYRENEEWQESYEELIGYFEEKLRILHVQTKAEAETCERLKERFDKIINKTGAQEGEANDKG
jgi:hypothetical protein